MNKDVIVIGGGAAGLMCAIEAGKRVRSVLVIERAERLGNKILISGGGRCNFTNVNAGPDNFLSANPHFCKSALARYTPADFIALVERHAIRYHEKKLGQLFCDGSSRQIVEMLQKECAAARVEIRLGCHVGEIRKGARFQLRTNQGDFTSDSLVIATGGLSFPKLGATDFGYRLAQTFGLKLVEPRPGLVPLTLTPAFDELSGVSVDTVTSVRGVSFRENILLTHRGLSGPAILQISNYWQNANCGRSTQTSSKGVVGRVPSRGERLALSTTPAEGSGPTTAFYDAGKNPLGSIQIDLFPDRSAQEILNAQRQSAMELVTVLSQHLPRRFVQAWCERFAPSRPLNRYSSEELAAIAHLLHHWEIYPSGTEGYAKAEVTFGGVDTDELSSKTMETRRVPGLYFIGEVVDVTGWLGGYNFQWAWASGFAAGQSV